jgi:hypothetical protein
LVAEHEHQMSHGGDHRPVIRIAGCFTPIGLRVSVSA